MNPITLTGCAPDILIHYLKALGILRLVGEQLDTRVRGAWHGSAFVIETEKTKDELVSFFLNKYRPTPIVAPWNGGSSFYPKDRSQRETADALCALETERLDDYRETIRRAREIVGTLLESPKDKDEKAALLRVCRRELPDAALEWLDAAFVLSDERTSYPPLLGTGGNDGRLEFTINFMARLLLVLPEAAKERDHDKRRAQSERNLRFALFAEGAPVLESAAVGQFHPGGAGGVNLTQGVTGGALVNAWDFVLAIEGALLLASATTRQLAAGVRVGASFPFTAQSSTVGYGTATIGESVRAEMWLPIWSRMSSLKEIAHVFGEGRARFGGQPRRGKEKSWNEDESRGGNAVEPRRDARSGFDFARAVAELGVDRGIDAFARYGFIERNGLAYLATPLGHFEVPSDKETNSHAVLIAEIDGWLERLRRATRSTDKTPPRFIRARLNVEEAIFDLCASRDEQQRKEHLRAVLLALGTAETELARSPKFRGEHVIPPLASLTTAWADECDDGSPEYRIACALASIVDRDGLAPVRVHLEPVEFEKKKFDWSTNDVRVVWGTGVLARNLALVLRRRWVDARREDLWSEAQRGANRDVDGENASLVLHAERAMRARRPALLTDVAKFIDGEVDENKIETLLRALMLINWRGEKGGATHASATDAQPSAADDDYLYARLQSAYSLLKLLFLPRGTLKRFRRLADGTYQQSGEYSIRHEPGIVPLLLSGNPKQVQSTFKLAEQRLKSSGLMPFTSDFHLSDARGGARLAAALLIPISYAATRALDRAALRPPTDDSTNTDNGEE
jgi:CRISPR-associated protein Csx17